MPLMLKDASVIGLFMVGTWAVVELWVRPGTLARRVGLVAVAACALSYVRMSRFYVPAFLELAILMALALAALKHMQRSSVALASRSAALGLLLVVDVARLATLAGHGLAGHEPLARDARDATVGRRTGRPAPGGWPRPPSSRRRSVCQW